MARHTSSAGWPEGSLCSKSVAMSYQRYYVLIQSASMSKIKRSLFVDLKLLEHKASINIYNLASYGVIFGQKYKSICNFIGHNPPLQLCLFHKSLESFRRCSIIYSSLYKTRSYCVNLNIRRNLFCKCARKTIHSSFGRSVYRCSPTILPSTYRTRIKYFPMALLKHNVSCCL